MSQFGIGAEFFSEAGLLELLNSEDYSSPVTLLQIISVTDDAGSAQYESDMVSALEAAGAQLAFASKVSGRLLGERVLARTARVL